MGIGSSQPQVVALPPGSTGFLNIQKLASLSKEYESLKQALLELQSQEVQELNTIHSQRQAFEQKLTEFQRDFQAKLQEQLKRNANLNTREKIVVATNANLKRKLNQVKSQLTQNTASGTSARMNVLQRVQGEALQEKERLEAKYRQELEQLQKPLSQLKEQLAEKQRVSANLNQRIQAKQTQFQTNSAAMNQKKQAELQRLKELLEAEKATFSTKKQELESQLSTEMATISAQKMEELQLELEGIKKKTEAETQALIDSAQVEKEKLLAEAANEIAATRQQEEMERLARLEEDTVQLEKERQKLAQEKSSTEEAIRILEQKASTNVNASEKLRKEREALVNIQLEQAAFQEEKQRILAEQQEAKEEMKRAQQEASQARQAVDQAIQEKALADAERLKAEKIEKYRKHVYQIIKYWIAPLEKVGIKTYHDDVKDDYYFQKGTTRHDWIQQKTIEELNQLYPTLKLQWQPRPSYNAFSGGGRKARSGRKTIHRRKIRPTRKMKKKKKKTCIRSSI